MKIFKKPILPARNSVTHGSVDHPFGDLREQMRKLVIKQFDVTSENTPTNGEVGVATILQITIIFPVEWYNKSLVGKPRPLIQFGYDVFRIFEKHPYYISAQVEQNRVVAFFGNNSAADTDLLFQIAGILNYYYQEWGRALETPPPGIKIALEANQVVMSKQPRNFLNTNPLNTNDFLVLTTVDERFNTLQFAQNAFYVEEKLAGGLSQKYRAQLQGRMGSYYISTAKTLLNGDFKW